MELVNNCCLADLKALCLADHGNLLVETRVVMAVYANQGQNTLDEELLLLIKFSVGCIWNCLIALCYYVT